MNFRSSSTMQSQGRELPASEVVCAGHGTMSGDACGPPHQKFGGQISHSSKSMFMKYPASQMQSANEVLRGGE
eukprot:1230235-Rhodomonas_salina.1